MGNLMYPDGTVTLRIASIATRTEDIKVAWRQWAAIPRKGDHIHLKREDIFGTVVSVMWTDEHVAVVVKP